MIKVDDVKFGFAPYGTASGLLVFNILLSTDNKTVDELEDDNLKVKEFFTDTEEEDVKNRNFYYPNLGEMIYRQIIDKVVDNGMEDYWEDALLSKHFIFFKGDGLTSPENILPFCSLIDTISKFSIEPQKEKFQEYSDYIVSHNGQQPNWQPLPPKIGLYTTPEYYTGMDDFYPQFNLVYIPIDLYNENKLIDKVDDVKLFSIIEMMRNPFSIFILKIKTLEEIKTFVNTYLKNDEVPIHRDRIFVVLDEYNQDIVDIVVDEKLRLNISLKGEDIIEL